MDGKHLELPNKLQQDDETHDPAGFQGRGGVFPDTDAHPLSESPTFVPIKPPDLVAATAA